MLDGATATAAGGSGVREPTAPTTAATEPPGAAGSAEHRQTANRLLSLMGGRFTRDTLIYVAGMLAVGPFSLVSVAVLTRVMVPAQYGRLAVLMVFASYLTTLYNTGSLHGTFMYVYGASEGEGDDVDSDATITSVPRRALGTGVALTLMIVTLGTAVCWVLAPSLTGVLAMPATAATLVRLAAISAAAGALWRLTVNVLRMERRPERFAAFNALRPLFVVGGTVPLVVLGFGIKGALWGTTLGTLVATAACMSVAWRSYAFAFSWTDAREIVRRGAMVVVPVMCLFVVHSADVVLLGHFAPAREVGIYRVASRFATVPSYFASAFLLSWSPLERSVLFQATYRHVGQERVRSALVTYFLVAGMTIVVLLDVLSDDLVLLAGRAYRSAAPLIPLIGVSFVCYGLFIVLVRTIKVEKGRMLLYSAAAILAVALEISLSFFTIPWLGAYGVPLAMAGGLLAAIALWIAVARWLMGATLEFQARPLVGLAGAVALAVLVQVAGLHLWPAGRPLVLVLTLASYLVALVAFGAVPRHHFKPLASLARATVRRGIGGRDPTPGLEHLESGQRSLLAALERDGTPLAVLAERRHRTEGELRSEYTAILRRLIGVGKSTPELDERLGRYLLSREPEAQRDKVAHEIIEDGADALEVMELNEAAQKLRGLSRQAWAAWSSEAPARGHRVKLEALVEHLTGLPESHRRAAVMTLRDGLTPAQVAAATGLSEQLVAARVVRVLRSVAHLGHGGPHDAAIGMALLGSPPGASRPPETRGVGLVYDEARGHSRRRWRRAGAAGLAQAIDPRSARRSGVR
jgi:O-antigen/teichoic acid export membrane protein